MTVRVAQNPPLPSSVASGASLGLTALQPGASGGAPSAGAETVFPRAGTAAAWTTVNPVLLLGEDGLESDTGFKKTGDGVSSWNSLKYSGIGLLARAGDLPSLLDHGPFGPCSGAYPLLASGYGVLGDGTGRALSTVFPSLAAAQAAYPLVSSLTQTVDWAAHEAWSRACIANGSLGICPAPPTSYVVNTTCNLVPAPGQTILSVKLHYHGGMLNCFRWSGTVGTDGQRPAVFNMAGFKEGSELHGLSVNVTSNYVVPFEIDNPCTTFASSYATGQASGTSINMTSTANLTVGQTLDLSRGTANDEQLVVASIIDATHLTFTSATAKAHTSADKVESQFSSFSQSGFFTCYARIGGALPGVCGWRKGHSDSTANGVDISFLHWVNCGVDGNALTGNAGSTGTIGWCNEGLNSLNHTWTACWGYFLDTMVTTVPTTGSSNTAGSGAQGGLKFINMGTTSNALDFQLRGYGNVTIDHGRFEKGQRLLEVGLQGSTVVSTVKLDNCMLEAYTPTDGKLIVGFGSTVVRIDGGIYQPPCPAPGPTIAATYASGQTSSTSIQVSSTTGLRAGAPVAAGSGTANYELLTIASIVDGTHLKFTTTTAQAHAIGETLVPLWDANMITLSSTSSSSRGALRIDAAFVGGIDPFYGFGAGVSGATGDYGARIEMCIQTGGAAAGSTAANGATGMFKDVWWSSTGNTRDGIYWANSTPGSNPGAATFLHLGSSTPGGSPRARLGKSGAPDVVLISDASSGRATSVTGTGLQVQGRTTITSGLGSPSANAGAAGDIYVRIDATTTANARIYICTVAGGAGAATWVGII